MHVDFRYYNTISIITMWWHKEIAKKKMKKEYEEGKCERNGFNQAHTHSHTLTHTYI